MKKINRFLNSGLPDKDLHRIFGGAKPIKTTYDGQCDVHHDENDNDTVDSGECIEFVECENNK